jgi:phosphoglycolate phosphatase-like HAD superfamily hydrolase
MTGKFCDIRAVIFDLDGTLVSVEERFYRVFLDTLRAYHQPPVEKEIFMKKFSVNKLDDFLDLEDAHAFWVDFLKAYNGSYNELSKMIPGAREVLKNLKENGIKIGVITGRLSDPKEILAELHRFNLDSFVEAVVTKKLVFAQLKPDELFSRSLELIQVLEKIGADPSKSILVADYVSDIESAKSLGLRAVAVLSGSSDYESLRKIGPDGIIKSVVELPHLLGL